ncbi:hypothetical protein J6590_036633 [Homalodisca vitripennis]|nr:hypothetical protein J6590_036633 [Homalodisca vitripennis]
MASQAGRLQGQNRPTITHASSGHARRCLIRLFRDNRHTRCTTPLAMSLLPIRMECIWVIFMDCPDLGTSELSVYGHVTHCVIAGKTQAALLSVHSAQVCLSH